MMQGSPNNDMGMTYKEILGVIHGIVRRWPGWRVTTMDTPEDRWSPTMELLPNKKKTPAHSAATSFASLSHKLVGNILKCAVCNIARELKRTRHRFPAL